MTEGVNFFLLPCDGAGGVSSSTITSQGAGSDGSAVGESLGAESGSDTITWISAFSGGDETSTAEHRGWREEVKMRGGNKKERTERCWGGGRKRNQKRQGKKIREVNIFPSLTESLTETKGKYEGCPFNRLKPESDLP